MCLAGQGADLAKKDKYFIGLKCKDFGYILNGNKESDDS